MRILMRAHLHTDSANLAIRDGSLGKVFDRLFARLRPEATYFLVENGRRTVIAVFEMTGPEVIPEIAEPLFHDLGADLSFAPAMNAPELQAGLGAWTAAG